MCTAIVVYLAIVIIVVPSSVQFPGKFSGHAVIDSYKQLLIINNNVTTGDIIFQSRFPRLNDLCI